MTKPIQAAARALLLACALAAALLLGARGVALAHGALVSSSPKANSTLSASPGELRLVFSEPLEPGLARVSLVWGDGHSVTLSAAGDPHDVHALVAPLDSLGSGAYRVVWRIVSADGHPVSGSFVFRVELPAAPNAATVAAAKHDTAAPPEPAALEEAATWGPSVLGAPAVAALLRGLALGTLMALAGLLFFGRLERDADARRRARRVVLALAVAAPVLLLLHFGAWLVSSAEEHTLADAIADGALSSGTGRVEIARCALALLALWAVALARRSRLALWFAGAALVVSGATGHAAAVHPLWAAPAKAAHLMAAAVWTGGLIWLLLCDRTDGATFTRAAGRVSAAALAAVPFVVVSGVIDTLLFLPTPLDVLRSAYGAVVLAKVAGLVGLVLFGAYHRSRVLPRLDAPGTTRSFASTLRAEVALMAVVVLLGGLLAYVPTPAPVAPATHAQLETVSP